MSEEKSKLAETYEKATSSKKFTEDEMKTLKDIQSTYMDVQEKFGQAAITKIRINEQLEELSKFTESLQQKFVENRTTEKDFIKSINDKYGQGSLNPETGVFTPETPSEKK